ncbi:MAG: 6-carboxytetrahydropterin synthase QueD [Candidatus Omnitrophota bacterium]
MYELIITDYFSSAHYLREYEGACEKLHGHTWKVEISISGEKLNKLGLLIDFREAKSKLKELTDRWDHVCLNDLQEFKECNPSTENMARLMFQNFREMLPDGISMDYVRIWESETASVLYRE